MSKRARPYHKRWHGNALNGMRGLTLEERGAYNTLLDLMYDRQGPIEDDERRICGELDCDIRVWRRVKVVLVEKRKIHLHEGLIYNERVHRELGTSDELPAEVREKFATAPEQLSAKSEGKPKENNPTASRKIPEFAPLIQSTESRTPIAPKGGGPRSITKDHVEAIWAITPKVSRQRSGKADVERSLSAALRRGHPPERVRAGLEAYFASEAATKDGGAFVKGVHRMIEGDRWETFAPAETPNPGLFDAATSAAPEVYNPWPSRVREFIRNAYWNRLDWGPPPGRDGCTVPAEDLRAAGFTPNVVPIASAKAGGA